MIRLLTIIIGSFIMIPAFTYGQDDLTNYLDTKPPAKQKVAATFKTTKIINAQTNETVHKRTLDFRVGHRFGNFGGKTGGNHTFYGIDNASDIRIAFEYGITDALTIGLSRCKRDETFEGLAKFRLLQQTTDNKIPLAITLFGNITCTTKKDNTGIYQDTDENGNVTKKPFRRLNYCAQMIIARKFSSRLSLELVPSYVHRNFVFDPDDENDVFAAGAGGRIKITRSMSFIADYYYVISDFRRDNKTVDYFDPLGLGVEFETGGHVFSIMFSNSAGILESDYLVNTTDDWSKGGFKFSFNISRNFKL